MKIKKIAIGCMILCFLDLILIGFYVNQNKLVQTFRINEDTSDDTAENMKEQKEGRKIAITFDDGPHPVYTPMLLDGLKERGVKASFFVIGKNIPGNEKILKRMADEGHIIGNHTYHHVQLNGISDRDACKEVEETSELIKSITGQDTLFLRAPFGEWNKSVICKIDLIEVRWTVDTLDWTMEDVATIIKKGTTDIEENDIILMHDEYESSVKAALKIIDELQAGGFEFVTVDEIILD